MKSENNIKITINSIDWKRKLTSRKFWIAVAGFITTFLVAFGCTDSDVTQATGVIMAGGTLIAYIVGEGLVDYARAKDDEDNKKE